jgi:hypothetical protein
MMIKLWVQPFHVLIQPCEDVLVRPEDIGQLLLEVRIELLCD